MFLYLPSHINKADDDEASKVIKHFNGWRFGRGVKSVMATCKKVNYQGRREKQNELSMPPPLAKRLKLIPIEPDTPPPAKVEAKAVLLKVECAPGLQQQQKIGINIFVITQRILHFDLCSGGIYSCMYLCRCINKQVLQLHNSIIAHIVIKVPVPGITWLQACTFHGLGNVRWR